MNDFQPIPGKSPEQKTVEAVQKFKKTQPKPDALATLTEQVLTTQPSDQLKQFIEMKQMADIYSQSGALPANMNAGKALMAIQIGQDIGLSPTESIFKIFFVNGTASTYGEVMLMKMHQSGYMTEVLEKTNEVAKMKVSKDGREHIEIFTIEQARQAGLPPKEGSKAYASSPWTLYTANMLYWKCVANAKRFFCPEVMFGVSIKEDLDSNMSFSQEARGLTEAGHAFKVSKGNEQASVPTQVDDQEAVDETEVEDLPEVKKVGSSKKEQPAKIPAKKVAKKPTKLPY